LRNLRRNYEQFEFPRELPFFRRLSILRVAGGVCDHSRDLLWMGFVHGVAGALDFGRMALGPRVVPALKVRIDDLIVPATIPQLGFVFQAAAVSGVAKTLAAAST
jgi:hypothetical protein